MMYRLSDGTIVNLEYVAYITPPDRHGKCGIWLTGEEEGIECTAWDAESILKIAGAYWEDDDGEID